MEHLKDKEKFIVYKDGEDLPRYIRKIVFWLEVHVFNRISKRVNFLLTRINDSRTEIVAPDNSDKDEDGNWRTRVTDNGDFVFEKRISGTWTELNKIHGS